MNEHNNLSTKLLKGKVVKEVRTTPKDYEEWLLFRKGQILIHLEEVKEMEEIVGEKNA